MNLNPKLDLKIEKELNITPEQAYKGWTSPELFSKWFCPAPWTVVDARVDARPGGEFYTVMQSPEGDKFPGKGCVLEAIPGKKFAWTTTLLPDFRPAPVTTDTPGSFAFTAIVTFEAVGNNKTKYTAIARHADEASCKQHAEMGFEQGWGICADQLEKLFK